MASFTILCLAEHPMLACAANKMAALPYSTRYRWVIKRQAAIGFAEIAAVESRLPGYRDKLIAWLRADNRRLKAMEDEHSI